MPSSILRRSPSVGDSISSDANEDGDVYFVDGLDGRDGWEEAKADRLEQFPSG